MRRRMLVLKMLVLALDELVAKGERLNERRLVDLTLQYGRGVDVEAYEVTPFFDERLLDALAD